MQTIVVLLAVLVVAASISSLITVLVLRRWTNAVLAGGGSRVEPIGADEAPDFFDRKASFVVTTEREFDFSPDLVWAALNADGLFSWIPFVEGVRYDNGLRGIGATRTFDGKLLATAERVVGYEAGHKITVTGDRVSIPIVVKSFAQQYTVVGNGNGGTKLTWTIAARPRLGGLIPLRLFAPFVRPFATAGIRGLESRI